jgi:hypothetical protein
MLKQKTFELAKAKDILARLEQLMELLGPYDGKFLRKGDLADKRMELCAAADKLMGSDIPYELCFSGYLEKKRVNLFQVRNNIALLKGMITVFEMYKDAPEVIAYREAVERMDACRKALHDKYGYDSFTHMGGAGLFGSLGWSIRYIH